VFVNTINGIGYDAVLLARADDLPIDVDRIQARLERPEYSRVAGSLDQVGFRTATDLFGTYAGRAADLTAWLSNAAITTDRNLRLQYLAGLGLNLYQANAILIELLAAGPISADDYFSASPATMRDLRQILNTRQRGF
jgi:spermidine synthase